ncbi:hypothetical protein ACT3SZ_12415 [Corynebacterium sp. AOP40-9SA-29]|uniref:hypothetical protein n=1 Tax=Corynebacterium sp. AOP40-9SA-29 TaxID=3457677 RepID=UPI0040344890
MTPTDIVLIALVWAVVGLAVAVWRVRRRLRRDLDAMEPTFYDVAYVEVPDHERRLINHDTRLLTLEDSRSRTADIEVPEVDDPPDAPTTPTYRQESPDA